MPKFEICVVTHSARPKTRINQGVSHTATLQLRETPKITVETPVMPLLRWYHVPEIYIYIYIYTVNRSNTAI